MRMRGKGKSTGNSQLDEEKIREEAKGGAHGGVVPFPQTLGHFSRNSLD